MVDCWGNFSSSFFDLSCTHSFLFARVFCSFVYLHFFQHFLIYTHISLSINIFVILNPTFLILYTCTFIFVGFVCTVETISFYLETLIYKFQDLKLLCVWCHFLRQVMEFIVKMCINFPNRIWCCVRLIVGRLAGFFATFINNF